ncbi:hypothetical protein IQ06DRAFT_298196 [Phaeosphaeriaceae sp. SRC1lsM3a]|nr:hypothetical protein IQ06DRAFT_298196 [Stagonospora sp. SRC1lsM3a]
MIFLKSAFPLQELSDFWKDHHRKCKPARYFWVSTLGISIRILTSSAIRTSSQNPAILRFQKRVYLRSYVSATTNQPCQEVCTGHSRLADLRIQGYHIERTGKLSGLKSVKPDLSIIPHSASAATAISKQKYGHVTSSSPFDQPTPPHLRMLRSSSPLVTRQANDP